MSNEKISISTLRSLSVVCTRPVELNTRTGRYLVGCGKCSACLNSLAARRVSSIKQWAAKYKYCYMAVLTYAPEYLPYAEYSVDHTDTFAHPGKNSRVLNYTTFTPVPRDFSGLSKSNREFSEDLVEPQSFYVNTEELISFAFKQEVPIGCVSYANVRDYQNFTKRLRALIKKEYYLWSRLQSNETSPGFTSERPEIQSSEDLSFSYYVVSEYGEDHNRPHWHFLLCFNSDFISRRIVRFVSEVWPFGGTNTSLSRGYCAEYLASYLGSYYDHSGLFDDCPLVRPRQRHSVGFDHTFYKSRYSLREFEKVTMETCDGRVVKDAENFTCVFPTLNDYSRFFLRFPCDFRELPSLFRKMPFIVFGLPHGDESRINPVLDYSVPLVDYAQYCVNTWISKFVNSIQLFSLNPKEHLSLFDLYKNSSLSDFQYEFFKIFDIGHHLVFLARHTLFDSEYSNGKYVLSNLYKTIVGRLVTWFRHLRCVCFNWHIDNLTTFSQYCNKMADFVKLKDFKTLCNFYRRLEGFNNSDVTNFLYNLKFISYGTERESLEDSEDFSQNRAFLLATVFSQEQITRKKHQKRQSHLISGLI